LAALRQRSEQYFTACQSRAHFFRQLNGLPQCAQSFAGRSAFERIFATNLPSHAPAAPASRREMG
jgi:hypothetical protein